MKIYNYSHFTHEYLFESDASIDKEASKAEGKDVYYLPADATFTKPPKTLKFEVAVYENGWQKKADYRDCWMVDEEMQPKKQDKIGDLPDGFIYITDTQAAKIQEDDLYYIIEDGQLVENPNYEEEKAQQRKYVFLKDFFKVDGFGYYRRQPKGYQSAVESMNVLFNIANVTDGIQAGLIVFYQEPDFTKPEECTEEWLVEHQIVMPAMSKVEFMQLYVVFMTAWNREEHEVMING